MNQTIVSEIPCNLLFRYRINCPKHGDGNTVPGELPTACKLPVFSTLNDNHQSPFADIRAAWSPDGLYFWMKVKGKKQSLWCRNTQLLDSDGLQLWIDTRDTHNIHRASKFCHWFLLLPSGGGNDQTKPVGTMLKINRAKEHSPSLNQTPIKISSSVQKTGYELAAFLPAAALNGWNPIDHRRIGFSYVATDRELGQQSLSVGMDYPVPEDPSLWNTLVLED